MTKVIVDSLACDTSSSPYLYRTGSATLLRVAISSVETRKSRDFLWWKLRGISEEVTRVQRVAWKTSVEILATSV